MNIKKVSPGFIIKNKGNINVIDIRTLEEHTTKNYPHATRIDMDEIKEKPHLHLKKDQKYYFLCGSGNRATVTATTLAEKGYETIVVEGGIKGFDEKDLKSNGSKDSWSCKLK